MTDEFGDFVSPVNPLLHRLHHGQHIQENRRIHQSPSGNPQATDSLIRQLPRPRRIPQNRSKVTSSSPHHPPSLPFPQSHPIASTITPIIVPQAISSDGVIL